MIELYIENLHNHRGQWFELPTRWAVVEEKLGLEDGQEHLVTDYMAPFKISNFDNFDEMNEAAELLDEHSSDPATHYLGELVEYGFFSRFSEAVEHLDDIHVYTDCFSYADYAEQMIEELGYLSGLPDIIKWNIDYKGVGEDIRHDGNLYQANDNTIIEVLT